MELCPWDMATGIPQVRHCRLSHMHSTCPGGDDGNCLNGLGLANEGKVVVRHHAFRVAGAIQMDHFHINLGVPESSAPGSFATITRL